jgi:hypothetical protein
MKISIDKEIHSTKPQNPGDISKRIFKYCADISIQTLARHVTQPYGRTWMPAYFEEHDGKLARTNACWAGQTLFALDFDSGITIDEVLERCKKYKVIPAFIYTTFSSVDNNKFRAVFQNPFEVQDIRVRNVIQLALMTLFPEADSNCKDAARMYHGGKEIIFHEYDEFIDIAELVISMCEYCTISDSKNSATNIKRYCQRTGINIINGLPHIEVIINESQNCKDYGEHLYIYYRKPRYSLQNDISRNSELVIIHFNDKATINLASSMKDGKYPKVDVLMDSCQRNVVENVDFMKLVSVCKLYAGFISGKYWAYHEELFGMATNLLAIKGGKAKLLEGISSNDYDLNKWKFTANYINKSNYFSMNCDNYCPFKDECNHAKNMIDTVKLKKGRVKILEQPKMISLIEAESKLASVFKQVLDSQENKVFVIKAPAGIGKTELYLPVKNTTIALPRHNLKAEVSKRMNEIGNHHEVIPELPKENEDFLAELNSQYVKGYYKGATDLKKEMAMHNKSIAEYLEKIESIKNYHGTFLTTHERLLFTNDNNDQIIIDEDITTTLLKIDTVSIIDLIAVTNKTNLFGDVLKAVNDAEFGVVNSISFEMLWDFVLVGHQFQEVIKQIQSINTNLLGFLNCSEWVKMDNGMISYITKRSLPQKKTIILSATANEYICKLLFGDRLEFIDIEDVEKKGRIVQYPQWSFSRHQMEKEEKFIPIAKAISGHQPVITYKKFSSEFPNCIATFGNVTGIDAYAGKDIVIVGTPHVHPTTYLLYASVLGVDIPDDVSLYDLKIERNGMEFYFYTFKSDALREIQLYFIESELTQAIGRARLLRNDCTVTLLSRLPIAGAEFVYLSKEDEEKLREGFSAI